MATIVVVSRQRPRLTVSPAEATVAPGTSLTFIAQLTGLSTGLVTWAVSEGTAVIDASGMFLAPFAGGVYHVIASSLEDPSLTATATVTVPQLVVSVTPSSATVPVGNTIQLAVSPQLGATPVVSWAVAEGAIGGGVSPSGLYTAPVTPGAYHVVATSLALPAINGEAVIQVVDPGPNLFDRGGPVLPTAHVYLIWWGDQGALAAPRAELESFLSVLDGSSYLGLGDEYLHGGTAHVSLRGEFSDPSTPAEAFNGSIAPEACAVITAAGQRVDPLGIYFVFTSFPLTAAGAAGWHGGDTCAGASYRLAWVEAFEGVIDPCEGRDGIGAAVVAFFSHELLETMTDPDGNAWKDVDGEEVADKCPQTCHTIGSHSWYTNALWSNTTGSCR